MMNAVTQKPLSELVEILTGLPLRRQQADNADATEYPVIRLKNLTDNWVLNDAEALDRMRLEGGAKLMRYRVQEGDVLVTSRGTVTNAAMVGKDVEGAIVSANILILRPTGGLSSGALLAWLQTPRVQHDLQAHSRGSTVLVVSRADIGKLMVPVLSEEAQAHAGSLVESMAANEAALQEISALRMQVGRMTLAQLFGQLEAS